LGVRTLHFTQEQARDVVGVSAEKLRHWRKVVPYLQRKAGKAARFTFADMLGLAVTLQVVDCLGVGIGNLRTGVDKLFELLSRMEASRLSDMVAVVSTEGCRLCPASEAPWSTTGEAVVAVPCWPLVARLSGQVLPIPPDPQSALPFRPQVLQASVR
jgi:hypothetical protein